MKKEQRRDPAIKDLLETEILEAIIRKAQVCHMAMVDGDKPYVLGFNFGYVPGAIYLHSGMRGKKFDVIAQNPNVAVYFDVDHRLFARNHEVGCSWRMAYRSVLAHGKACLVENFDEKVMALNLIMKQYSDKDDYVFGKPAVNNVAIIRIDVHEMTGRSFEY